MSRSMPTYTDLVAEFPLRPIRSERQLKQACALAGRLAVCGRLSRDAQDYLTVLSGIIETYEDKHHAIDDSQVSPREALEFLIETNGLTLSKLAAETGIQVSTLSDILHGKRELNLDHVRRLARRFGVDPGLFIEIEPAAV
jgi:HTH-type transcriptional regulator / antitoxin HigA